MSKRSPWDIQQTVILALVLRELKTRFGAHRMGVVWLFMEPVATIAIMLAILGSFRGASLQGIDYPVFLLVGIVPFNLFKSIALRIMEGVEGNKGLFTYRYIKPMDVFLARTLLEICLYTIVLVAMLAGLAWLGFAIAIAAPLEFLLLFGLMAAGGMGLGLVFSVIVEFMPEAKPVIRMIFMPLYLLSGVLFSISSLPLLYQEWLLLNPLVHGVELIRISFIKGYKAVPDVSVQYVLGVVLVLLFVGLALYRNQRMAMVAR